jgi:hypothetical protein
MHNAHTTGVWAASISIHSGAPQALVGCLELTQRAKAKSRKPLRQASGQ